MGEPRRRTGRVPAEWFDDTYREDPDPWGFTSRWYERRKADVLLASLPRRRYRAGFEPGCSFGALTARLADRCDALLAADVVASVVDRARAALAGAPGVRVERLAVPDEWPGGPWDLVVLSELAYYFPAPELADLLDRAVGSLEAGGDLVAVHWTGATDYPLTGDEVHQRIDGRAELERVVTHREAEFVLGCWRRR